MEVKINKDIREFSERIFFGLTIRQFIFSICACAVAIGLYFLLKPFFGIETLSWICILGAAPFGALGFVKYNGMPVEKIVISFIKSKFLIPKKIGIVNDEEELIVNTYDEKEHGYNKEFSKSNTYQEGYSEQHDYNDEIQENNYYNKRPSNNGGYHKKEFRDTLYYKYLRFMYKEPYCSELIEQIEERRNKRLRR